MSNSSTLGRIYQQFMKDSLYRNSIYLMGSTFVVSLFGFLYWVLAAHLYSTKSVGLVAALVAISNVVMTLSLLGFDNSFIRYLPKSKNQDQQLNTGLTASSLFAIFVSILYLIAIALFIPKLGFITGSVLWVSFFIFFMVMNTLNFLTNYPFVAHRITHIVLLINTGNGILRLILLFALVRFGFNGLILAHVIAVFAAVLATLYCMRVYMYYHFRPHIDWQELKRMGKYTFHSYLSIVFLTLPTYIIPIFIISRLGDASSAYYYIVAVIIAALNVIPMATSQAMFAEGVWNETSLKQHLIKASKIIVLLTVPAIAVLVIGGRLILTIFGTAYAQQGYALLVIIAIAGIPKIFSYVLSTILRIEHRVVSVAIVYAIYALIVLVGSYVGLHGGHGLVSIGWATLAAEMVSALIFCFLLRTRLRSLLIKAESQMASTNV